MENLPTVIAIAGVLGILVLLYFATDWTERRGILGNIAMAAAGVGGAMFIYFAQGEATDQESRERLVDMVKHEVTHNLGRLTCPELHKTMGLGEHEFDYQHTDALSSFGVETAASSGRFTRAELITLHNIRVGIDVYRRQLDHFASNQRAANSWPLDRRLELMEKDINSMNKVTKSAIADLRAEAGTLGIELPHPLPQCRTYAQ